MNVPRVKPSSLHIIVTDDTPVRAHATAPPYGEARRAPRPASIHTHAEHDTQRRAGAHQAHTGAHRALKRPERAHPRGQTPRPPQKKYARINVETRSWRAPHDTTGHATRRVPKLFSG